MHIRDIHTTSGIESGSCSSPLAKGIPPAFQKAGRMLGHHRRRVHHKQYEGCGGCDYRPGARDTKPRYPHEPDLYKLLEIARREAQSLYLDGCIYDPNNVAVLSTF